MLQIHDFLHLTEEQQHEMLIATYDSIADAYDRFRIMNAVTAMASGEDEEDEENEEQED